MQVTIHPPSRAERGLIRRMMELYLHDFSEFDEADLDEHGLFGYGDLDYFWFEPTHAAFIIRVDNNLAGFVLVDNEVFLKSSERSLTEFFVLRKYRRRGVGQQAAIAVFKRLRARWEVHVVERNLPAQHFWRTVLAAHTRGQFQETAFNNDDWVGPVFSFDNRLAKRKPKAAK